jgi:hypothetical protein
MAPERGFDLPGLDAKPAECDLPVPPPDVLDRSVHPAPRTVDDLIGEIGFSLDRYFGERDLIPPPT